MTLQNDFLHTFIYALILFSAAGYTVYSLKHKKQQGPLTYKQIYAYMFSAFGIVMLFLLAIVIYIASRGPQ